ncbi:hypothetical protein [Flavobacterium sp.]|uniref:hypothetical protein n=1 Tax=Flavobacterium sp. TaxID=239 RepID=UPI0039E4239D
MKEGLRERLKRHPFSRSINEKDKAESATAAHDKLKIEEQTWRAGGTPNKKNSHEFTNFSA